MKEKKLFQKFEFFEFQKKTHFTIQNTRTVNIVFFCLHF